MKNKALLLILILAFLVRILGVKPGYPAGYHEDEWMSHATVTEMIKHGDLKPRQFFYPSGVSLVHYFVYRAFILPPILLKTFVLHPRLYLAALKIGFPRFFREFSVLIFGKGGIRAIYWSRYLTALMSTLIVFFTFLVGKKLFNQRVGLLAAFFLIFNYRHVLSSTFGLPDIPNGLITIISFYLSFLLWKQPSRRHYLLAGLGAALTFSTKFQPFALVPFGLAHFFIFLKKPSWHSLLNPDFFLALALTPLVFVVLNPYLFLDYKEALRILSDESRRYAMGRKKLYPHAPGWLYQYGIGKLMSGAILLGMAVALLKYSKKALFLLSIISPFLFVLFWYSRGGLLTRNFVPVIPFLLIFAAVGIEEIVKKFSIWLKWDHKKQAILIILLAIVFCAIPARDSLVCTFYRMKTWNFVRLADWLRRELPYNSQVAIQRGVSDAVRLANLPDKFDFYDFDFTNENINLAEWREAGFDYIILSYRGLEVRNIHWEGWENALGTQYWQIPIVRLANGFPALMAQEILRWSVADFLKPWQTFENRFVVARIPPDFKSEKNLIKGFHFDQAEDAWRVMGKFGFKIEGYSYNADIGYQKKGSLQIESDATLRTLRFVSSPILVEPGEKYRVEAWAKREKTREDSGRDGFLRLEFYDQEGVKDLEKVGMDVSLSSRILKPDQWERLEVSEIAPANSYLMTISFQLREPYKGVFYLDDIEVFQEEVTREEIELRKHFRKSQAGEAFIYPLGIL